MNKTIQIEPVAGAFRAKIKGDKARFLGDSESEAIGFLVKLYAFKFGIQFEQKNDKGEWEQLFF